MRRCHSVLLAGVLCVGWCGSAAALAAEPKTILTLFEKKDGKRAKTAAISPDGKVLALAVYADDELMLFRLPDGKPLQSAKKAEVDFRGHESCDPLVFSPDAKQLGFMNSRPNVMDVATGKVREFTNPPLNAAIGGRPMFFTTDSTRLGIAETGGAISLGAIGFYDMKTGKLTKDGGEAEGIRDTLPHSLVLSPDGKTLAIDPGFDRIISLRELAQWEKPWNLEKGLGTLAGFLPDSKAVVTVAWKEKKIHLADAKTGKATATAKVNELEVFTSPKRKADKETRSQMRLSPDGNKLAITSVALESYKRYLRVFEPKTGKVLATVCEQPTEEEEKAEDTFSISGLTFAADSKSVSYVLIGPPTTRVRTLTLDEEKRKGK